VPYSNQINILLEKTCGLSRTYPFTEVNDTEAASTNKCPSAVSIDCALGMLNLRSFRGIYFIFVETPKTTVTASVATTSSVLSTTTTTSSVLTTTTTTTAASTFLFGKNSIDLEALSLLLAEHQRQNLSLAFLQGQNHKSLFSDDEARKNGANQFSFILSIHLIYLSFLSILYIIF
jgi:hypothetical protein